MQLSKRWELAHARYERTCHTFARNSVRQLPGMAENDIVQELLVVLWECCIKYDPEKGASFNTLFQGCAKNRIITLIRRGEAQKRKAIVTSLDEDAVRIAVDSMFSSESTEDRCERRMELQEAVEQYGVEALNATGRKRRRVA